MPSPTRVAILGAGPAGLSAAWHLSAPTTQPPLDVTVHLMGWQAGGHCATGRVMPTGHVDQNGTHYLFGCYDEAFSLLREAYEVLEANGVTEFGRYDAQLAARDTVVMKQFFNGGWTDWVVRIPTNRARPGDPPPAPDPTTLALEAVQGLLTLLCGWRGASWLQALGVFPTPQVGPPSCALDRALLAALDALRSAGHQALALAWELLTQAAARPGVANALLRATASALAAFRTTARLLLSPFVSRDVRAARLHILLEVGTTTVIGMVRDGGIANGLDSLDRWDFRDWLRRNGAAEDALWSGPVVTYYDAIANYRDGDILQPDTSAGLAIKGIYNLVLRYKGAMAWQLTWEVGDSFIAPVFAALRLRGVRFCFFRRIEELTPSADGRTIATVRYEQQATVRAGDDQYQPFMPWLGRHVWPDRPLFDQLEDPVTTPPKRFREFYQEPTGPTHTLEHGRDYDHLVWAMPVGMVRFAAQALILAHPQTWGRVATEIQTTETQSVRLWFRDSLPQLGWRYGQAIVSGYAQPYNTWEDQTDVLQSERWPSDRQPHTEATVFGPLPAPAQPPPRDDVAYPVQQQARADADFQTWWQQHATGMWPALVDPRNPPTPREGAVVEQDVRANIGPLERYLICAAGTLSARPRADESGYENLWLSGDWVRNGLDVACVEGAIRSGRQAATALLQRLAAP